MCACVNLLLLARGSGPAAAASVQDITHTRKRARHILTRSSARLRRHYKKRAAAHTAGACCCSSSRVCTHRWFLHACVCVCLCVVRVCASKGQRRDGGGGGGDRGAFAAGRGVRRGECASARECYYATTSTCAATATPLARSLPAHRASGSRGCVH